MPGTIIVERAPARLSTVLGSCVAVSLWDLRARVGGLNHYSMPSAPPEDVANPLLYAPEALSHLLAQVLAAGGQRATMRAGVFGGGHLLAQARPGKDVVGDRNVEAALTFLTRERIGVLQRQVGGPRGRKLLFDLATGEVELNPI